VKAKFLTNQKARFVEQKQIAKAIFCDAARQQNYLFGIAKNLSHTQSRNIFPESSVL
jgi:hypothetical protein